VKRVLSAIAISAASMLAPSTADAQTYVTPFVGGAFGGSTDDTKLTFGGNISFLGSGVLGFGLDFGYTKDFFGDSFDNNNVTTLMGNLILSNPSSGGTRLYASGGVGLLKTRVESASRFLDVNDNDWGMNVGAGFYLAGDKGIGLNGDIRYIRRLTDPEPDGEFDLDLGSLRYWRATAGVSFKF
jgi:hypothetical protein